MEPEQEPSSAGSNASFTPNLEEMFAAVEDARLLFLLWSCLPPRQRRELLCCSWFINSRFRRCVLTRLLQTGAPSEWLK